MISINMVEEGDTVYIRIPSTDWNKADLPSVAKRNWYKPWTSTEKAHTLTRSINDSTLYSLPDGFEDGDYVIVYTKEAFASENFNEFPSGSNWSNEAQVTIALKKIDGERGDTGAPGPRGLPGSYPGPAGIVGPSINGWDGDDGEDGANGVNFVFSETTRVEW